MLRKQTLNSQNMPSYSWKLNFCSSRQYLMTQKKISILWSVTWLLLQYQQELYSLTSTAPSLQKWLRPKCQNAIDRTGKFEEE